MLDKSCCSTFCRKLATSVCKKAKIRKTYLYVTRFSPNDSHFTVHFDNEGDKRTVTVQECCSQAAIFSVVSEYLDERGKNRP